MQRTNLVFNTKQFAENMRKWMDLYKKYKPDFFITSRYLDSLPNFSLILRDINTLVTGNFANEVQLREILNFFHRYKKLF